MRPTTSPPPGARRSVFVLWQSLVVASYRSFFTRFAADGGFRVALATPNYFKELGGQNVECAPPSPPFQPESPGHAFFVLRALTLHVQAVLFWGLGKAMKGFFKNAKGEPKIFLCVAEPYSVTAFVAWLVARIWLGQGAVFICYTAQNLVKSLPLPLRMMQNMIFRQSAAILAVGREQEIVLRRQGYPGPIIPFPLWFDSTLYFGTPAKESGKIGICYAGNLSTAKGVEDFIECLEQNSARWASACTVYFAGTGPLEAHVRETTKRLCQRGMDAIFMGRLPAEEMPGFFSRADIIVVPSRTTPGWKEQFGRVIVEAQAVGLVALGSDSGEIPRVIGRSNCIFRESDPADMARVLDFWISQLSDPEARRKIRNDEAEKALRSYSDQALAANFAKTLRALVTVQGQSTGQEKPYAQRADEAPSHHLQSRFD